MEYLHSRGIIHRDLKSSNVLIDENESAKIMDFGLSRIIDRQSKSKTKRIGTSVYMAPEVVLASKYDEKCDMYSMAMLMYVTLTENENPFGNQNLFKIEFKVSQNPDFRPDIGEIDKFPDNKEVEFIKKVIQICWNHDPNKRFSFHDLGNILKSRGIEKKREPTEIFRDDVIEVDPKKEDESDERLIIKKLRNENNLLRSELEKTKKNLECIEKEKDSFSKEIEMMKKKFIDDPERN